MSKNKRSGLIKWKNRYFERYDSIPKIILIYAILITCCIIAVYPLKNMLSVSLRPNNALISSDLSIIPEGASLDNYRRIIDEGRVIIWLKNSLKISIVTAIFSVGLSASAGYAFSRFKFKGKKQGMLAFLVTQMFPGVMLLTPTFILLTTFKLNNSHLGLLIPYVATSVPFSVWLLKGYFDTIPYSLEESAYIDGCSPTRTFLQIVVPLAKPALAIAALFAFMTGWSEFLVARVIITDPSLITLPVGLSNMMGTFTTDWGLYSATALITTVPVMLVFLGLSRYLVGGLTLGGVKE